MYKVARIHDIRVQPADLPDCMYKMPSVYDGIKVDTCNGENGSSSIRSPEKNSVDTSSAPASELDSYKSAVADVLKKQEDIRKRLEALEVSFKSGTLSTGNLNPVGTSTASTSAAAISKMEKVSVAKFTNHDLCIHFSALSEPLAIVNFINWLKTRYNVKVLMNVHLHSSVLDASSGDIAHWKEIQAKTADNLNLSRSEYDICVTMVVKAAVEAERLPKLVVDPASKSILYGSNNILRYLARLAVKAIPSLTSVYPEAKTDQAKSLYLIDSLLDQVEAEGGAPENEVLSRVNTLVVQKKFLCGEASLADFAVFEFGARLCVKTKAFGEAPLTSWLKSIEKELCSLRSF